MLLPVSSAVRDSNKTEVSRKLLGKLPAALLCIGLMTTLFLGKTMQTKVKIHLRIQEIFRISQAFQPEWNTDLLSLFCCILSLPSRSLNTKLLPRTYNCHVVHMWSTYSASKIYLLVILGCHRPVRDFQRVCQSM